MTAKLSATLRLRPTRIGFIVDPSDIASVWRMMRYKTCLWGGLYNPIIPYSDSLPAAWQNVHYPRPSGFDLANGYISFFEPDVFVDATGGGAAALGLADDKVDFFQPRVPCLDEFFAPNEHGKQGPTFGLCITDLYRDLYQKLF